MTAAPRKRAAAKAAPTKKGTNVTDENKQPDPDPTPDEAPAGLQLADLQHCPAPGQCFPYGLPASASHAACEHGETHAQAAES